MPGPSDPTTSFCDKHIFYQLDKSVLTSLIGEMGPLEEHHRPDVTDRDNVRESASVEEIPIGEASRESLSPGNLREPGLHRGEAAVREILSSGRIGER